MTTYEEEGGKCTAQAKWNPTTETVDIEVNYQVFDWKKNQPCPKVPVEGRADLLVDCGLGATFGQEEYWGVNPVTGIPVIDYGAVFGELSICLLDTATGKRTPSRFVTSNPCPYPIKRGGGKTTDEHYLNVGGASHITLAFILTPVNNEQAITTETNIILACDDDW